MVQVCEYVFSQITTANAPMTYLFELIEQMDTNIILKGMVFFVAKIQ